MSNTEFSDKLFREGEIQCLVSPVLETMSSIKKHCVRCGQREDPAQADVLAALHVGTHRHWHTYFPCTKGTGIGGCLTQTFFVHMLFAMHSAILVTMAFDRYLAICNPLRYATIITTARIAKLGLVGLIRAVLYNLPIPLLLSRLPFCASHMIPHTYCEYMSVAKMSCGDLTVQKTYGLVAIFVVIGFDVMLIFLSYSLIIMAVLQISSKNAYLKVLSSCTPHICVILIAYSSCLFSSLAYRYGQGISAQIHIIMSNIYFLIPPMLNPIVYGIKTKELCEKVGKYIWKR
ncbi:olfactory receptor 52P1-like [Carettochelys insculpta]|uniref:olfactory receptor 52P1-like n=1 Tax=Carettochelys insculpta TaxID=44489 RepID=UPI003EB904C3